MTCCPTGWACTATFGFSCAISGRPLPPPSLWVSKDGAFLLVAKATLVRALA
eukprot:CAMPEP_0176230768 /NCGR_PEP_ID=MMETSP0121_2-20121125/24463_1 /TAXON_ID=160619 /ORGANISM="Kryptoperidinium foliaceum, Strain CCMP 1326" /LENGTH=51 /DNA_ID=CAMNT_0017570109 /DNA_START=18 /DNA_END=170 /DNA_ORIENTATION=-